MPTPRQNVDIAHFDFESQEVADFFELPEGSFVECIPSLLIKMAERGSMLNQNFDTLKVALLSCVVNWITATLVLFCGTRSLLEQQRQALGEAFYASIVHRRKSVLLIGLLCIDSMLT